MGERNLFKTKLCTLYQKGRCPRQSCSFAHGDSDLRGGGGGGARFSAPFNGRRDYRGGDLRDKLERRRSPLRRYSPGRDARGRQVSRGHSPSNSGGKRSDRKRRKREHLDGQGVLSGSAKVSHLPEDRSRGKKMVSSDSRSVVGEQLRQARSEIKALNNHKRELKIFLDERMQEVDCLTSRIQELETQLLQEKGDCKRITSKIKKFVSAHKRYSHLQDELKRSHDKLQKLGDQLSSDAFRLGANEEDSSINILSDEETTANPVKGGVTETIQIEKHTQWGRQHSQFDNDIEDVLGDNGNNSHRIRSNGSKSKRKKIATNIDAAEKFKGHESGFGLPPTSMAAQAIDEGIETAEAEGDFEVNKTLGKRSDEGASNGTLSSRFLFPLPPPPPVPQNGDVQFKGHETDFGLPTISMAAHAIDEGFETAEAGGDLEVRKTTSKRSYGRATNGTLGSRFLIPLPPPPPVSQNAYAQYQGEDENVDVDALEDMADVNVV